MLMAPEPGAMPELVHTYQVEEGEEPPSFGEMGLLYSKPRAATVVAQTDGELLFLDRRDLKAALASMDMGDVLGALRKVEVLAPLMSCELQFVLDLMVRKPFADGQALCEQGEEGNTFFVLVEGSVECWSKASESAEAKMVLRVTRHQCLGERALQGPGRRAATVLAKGAVTALEISRATFEEAVGPLRVAADEHRAWQERAGRAAVPPSDLSGLAVGSLTRTATLWGTELSGVGVVDAPSAGRTFLVRNTAAAPGAAAPVCKGQTVLTAAPSVPVLPPVSRVVKDTRGVMEIIDTRPLCTVGQLLQHSGPVPESVAKVTAAMRLHCPPPRPPRTDLTPLRGTGTARRSRAWMILSPRDSSRSTSPRAWPWASRACTAAALCTGPFVPTRWSSRSRAWCSWWSRGTPRPSWGAPTRSAGSPRTWLRRWWRCGGTRRPLTGGPWGFWSSRCSRARRRSRRAPRTSYISITPSSTRRSPSRPPCPPRPSRPSATSCGATQRRRVGDLDAAKGGLAEGAA